MSFRNFRKKGGSDFYSHKNGGVGKIGGVVLISLSKIAHRMWHDHPFSQRNKTTERTVGLGVGGDSKVGGGGGGLDKVLKRRGGVGNIGGLHKIGRGLSTPLPTM